MGKDSARLGEDAAMPTASDDHASQSNERGLLAGHILALLAKITEQFDSEEHEEWQWLIHHSHDPRIIELLRDSTPTAMRVVNAIGRSEPVNGITIAAQFHIPKGTVSKVTRRLIAQNLISSEALPNNKKERLFRLTPLGRELFHLHRTFDEQMERGFIQFLQRYTPDELRLLVRVLQDAAETSFLRLGLQATDDDSLPL